MINFSYIKLNLDKFIMIDVKKSNLFYIKKKFR
jgi:hypothetical protein